MVASGVAIPAEVDDPDEPPHALFVGRLSPEKGILEFVEATAGLPRVIVGDGPLRYRVPDALGFLPRAELARRFQRAAVVVCPSRREGYGVVAREAMANGRPVVATPVGGLLDAVEDGVTGIRVPVGDVAGLRDAVVSLLADPALRSKLGAAGRERARERYSWEIATRDLVAAYRNALGDGHEGTGGIPAGTSG
jgi:glycosyltransferase involved in cell wall biosynthesis